MTDVHTKEQRSRNMSAIKSRGNKSTENIFVKMLKKSKITGWRRHYKQIPGTPDFAFPEQRVAVFIDGCFWHGCKKHLIIPKTNTTFWKKKIKLNRKRDHKINKIFNKNGWKILRIWEHQIQKPDNSPMSKLTSLISLK